MRGGLGEGFSSMTVRADFAGGAGLSAIDRLPVGPTLPRRWLLRRHDCCVVATLGEHFDRHSGSLLSPPLFSHTPP
jgi:hypothetical protein